MSTDAASAKAAKETPKDIKKEPSPTTKDKLYSGVVFEEMDDEKQGKPRYQFKNLKYHGDQIRDLRQLNAANSSRADEKNKLKTTEKSRSSSLSSALGYIISPVKYIASAFSYSSSSETQKAPEQSSSKLSAKRKGEASPKTGVSPKVSPTPDNISVAVSKIKETVPLPENMSTQTNLKAPLKTRIMAQTSQVNNAKDKTLYQRPKALKNNTKSYELKKSQSQQIKPSPKIFKTYSPRNYTGDITEYSPFHSSKLLSSSDVRIIPSNHTSFRVTSAEEAKSQAEKNKKKLLTQDLSPALASWSNNSSECSPPTVLAQSDEMLFPDVSLSLFPAYSIQNCSNSMSDDWKVPEPANNNSSFQSEFGKFGTGPAESPVTLCVPALSHAPTMLRNSSRDREMIIITKHQETVPTELVVDKNSVSDTPMVSQDSVKYIPAHEPTLRVKEQLQQRSIPKSMSIKSSENKLQPNDTVIIIRTISSASSKPSSSNSPKSSPKTKRRELSFPQSPKDNRKKVSRKNNTSKVSHSPSRKKQHTVSPANSFAKSSPRSQSSKTNGLDFQRVTKKKSKENTREIPPTFLTPNKTPTAPSSQIPGAVATHTISVVNGVAGKNAASTVSGAVSKAATSAVSGAVAKAATSTEIGAAAMSVTSAVTDAVAKTTTSAAGGALAKAKTSKVTEEVALSTASGAEAKAATSDVSRAGTAANSTTGGKVVGDAIVSSDPSERYPSAQTLESWFAQTLRSLSPKRIEEQINDGGEVKNQSTLSMPKSQPASTPIPQPASSSKSQPASSPKSQPASSPKPQPAIATKPQTGSAQIHEPASTPSPQPARAPAPQPASAPAPQPAIALKTHTAVVKEAIDLTSLTDGASKNNKNVKVSLLDFDQERNDDYNYPKFAKYFSPLATLHGEFP